MKFSPLAIAFVWFAAQHVGATTDTTHHGSIRKNREKDEVSTIGSADDSHRTRKLRSMQNQFSQIHKLVLEHPELLQQHVHRAQEGEQEEGDQHFRKLKKRAARVRKLLKEHHELLSSSYEDATTADHQDRIHKIQEQAARIRDLIILENSNEHRAGAFHQDRELQEQAAATHDRKLKRNELLGLIELLLPTLETPTTDGEAVVYLQPFTWDSGAFGSFPDKSQDRALRALSWCGGQSGDGFCDNPPDGDGPDCAGAGRSNGGGEGAVSATSANLNSTVDTSDGFAYWSKKGSRPDEFLYTNAFQCSTDLVTRISWMQNDSKDDRPYSNENHLAFLVDDGSGFDNARWYMSNETYTYVTTDSEFFQGFERTLADLDFIDAGTNNGDNCTRDGIKNSLVLPEWNPDASASRTGLPPGQTIVAFGFSWARPPNPESGETRNANTRIDDVILYGIDSDGDGVGDCVDEIADELLGGLGLGDEGNVLTSFVDAYLDLTTDVVNSVTCLLEGDCR